VAAYMSPRIKDLARCENGHDSETVS